MSLTSYRAAPPRDIARALAELALCLIGCVCDFFLEDLAVTYSPAS